MHYVRQIDHIPNRMLRLNADDCIEERRKHVNDGRLATLNRHFPFLFSLVQRATGRRKVDTINCNIQAENRVRTSRTKLNYWRGEEVEASIRQCANTKNTETEDLPNQHCGSILLGLAALQISPVCLGTTFIHFEEGPLDRMGKHGEALASTMPARVMASVARAEGRTNESHNLMGAKGGTGGSA